MITMTIFKTVNSLNLMINSVLNTRNTISVVSQCDITAELAGQSVHLPQVVAEGNGPPLLGWSWLQKLRIPWDKIFVNPVHNDQALQEFNSMFSSQMTMDCTILWHVSFANSLIQKDVTPRFSVRLSPLHLGRRKFRQYLLGCSFTLLTNHKALVMLLGEKNGISQLVSAYTKCWALLFSANMYENKYITFKENGLADYLPRAPLPELLDAADSAIACEFIMLIDEEGLNQIPLTSVLRMTWNLTMCTIWNWLLIKAV